MTAKALRTAIGTGSVPNIVAEGVRVEEDELLGGVFSVEVKFFADAPRVPLITVVADSDERALSVYEALRPAVNGMELFPDPNRQETLA